MTDRRKRRPLVGPYKPPVTSEPEKEPSSFPVSDNDDCPTCRTCGAITEHYGPGFKCSNCGTLTGFTPPGGRH